MHNRYDSARAFRSIALGTGTLLTIFLLLAFIPKLVSDLSGDSSALPPGREWEGQVMVAMFLTYMTGYAIGWWRSVWGGIVICLSACIVAVPFIIIQGHFNSLVFAIPLSVVGAFYIVLSVLESREKTSDRRG